MSDSETALPKGFEDLEIWVADWVLPGQQARSDKRLSSPFEAIQAFYDAILPQAQRILEYLDQRQLGAMSAPEERLLGLMLSFAEVTPAVEFYGQPAVIDGFSSDEFRVDEELPDLTAQT